MKKVIFMAAFMLLLSQKSLAVETTKPSWWNVQSVDTMKMSRDLAREKLGDASYDGLIEQQVAEIAGTGATHIAIATPYDKEFIPFVARWVKAARLHNLHIWFRGNFSGWEGWFGYSKITRAEHIKLTQIFIEQNPNLFENDDIFSSCPECENGGPGDPRVTGDIVGHRQFLIAEYNATKASFKKINRNVASNYFSMNGDVARVIMDKPTTQALDGLVTIDHYVATANQLANDIKDIAAQSGGRIALGEFGAPIPDIHGDLTELQQKQWIDGALEKLSTIPELVAVNYWTNVGSSTNLWNDDFSPRQGVAALTRYYSPLYIYGSVINEIDEPITNAIVQLDGKVANVDNHGKYFIPYINGTSTEIIINATGYQGSKTIFDPGALNAVTTLKKDPEDLFFKIRRFFYNLLH